MHKLSVVVPNWNGKDMLDGCLKSLLAQTMRADLVVVDNGSRDGSVEHLRANYPQVTIIELPRNRGFAGGVNAGFQHGLALGYKYVVLFNNDAKAEKGWLAELVGAAEAQPEAGIVASKLMHADKKRFDSTGEQFFSWGTPGPRGRGELDKGQFDVPEFVFGASGGSSLYRTKMLRHVGLFDEDFFAYYEDADLSFRAQLAGWKVYYQPSAVVYHEINATSARIHGLHAYHMSKNMPLLVWKNVPGRLLLPMLLRFSILYSVVLLGLIRQGKGVYAMKGMLVALVLLPKKIYERFGIQHRRRVPVAYIKSLITPGLPPGTSKLRRLLAPFGVKGA